MAIDIRMNTVLRKGRPWILVALWACLAGCGTGPLVGVVYTNVTLPLTTDLKDTPVPVGSPHSGQILEIREPFTGMGLNARVNSNAFGDIARQNGVDPLYFADQEVFSILMIWKSQKVWLYGETDRDAEPKTDPAIGP